MFDKCSAMITGHIKIYHPKTDEFDEEILVDKMNAIHFENFSEALAQTLVLM